MATVASQLERLAKIEGDESPPGADSDGEKNYRAITNKGYTQMNAGNGNYNINKLEKQVEPKNGNFEKVIWEQMAKYLASGTDKDIQLDQREAAEWAHKNFKGHDLSEFVAKNSSFMRTKAPQGTATPIIPQNWINDPVGLLYSEIPLLAKLKREKVAYGQGTIPRVTSAPSVNYVGENAQATLTTSTYDRLQTQWHEYQGISSITKELMYFAPLDAAAQLADGLKEMTGRFLQKEIIYGDGSTLSSGVTRVKGLIAQGASNTYLSATANGGTITASTVSNDVGRVQLALVDNNIALDGAFHVTSKGIEQFFASARNDYNYFFPGYNHSINGVEVVSTQQIGNSGSTVVGTGSTAVTLSGAVLLTVQPYFARVYDFGALNFLTTDTASWVDGGVQVNSWASRLVAMQISGFFDFLLHQPNAVTALYDNGFWSLSNVSGKDYLIPISPAFVPFASGSK